MSRWHQARDHRRQGAGGRAARTASARRWRACGAERGLQPGPRRRPGRRRSGQPTSTCAPRAQQTEEAGMKSFVHRPAGRRPRGGPAHADPRAEPRRPGPRHPGAAAAARRRSAPDVVLQAIDPDKDVDGFHVVNVGRLAAGVAERRWCPCTPLGCLRLIKSVRARSRRPEGDRRRPLQHRRQADGAAAAGRELHGDDRPLPDRRSRRPNAAGRHPGRRRRPAGADPRRLDQARRHRHRRRHQSRSDRGPARPGWSATSPSTRRWTWRGGDHTGAGRRRADDGGLPAAQHADRRLPFTGASTPPEL